MNRARERTEAASTPGGVLAAAIGLAVMLFTACVSSSQVKRIEAMRDRYDQWPIEVRQAVLDGKVGQGMTEEMVRTALGDPQEVATRPSSPGEPEESIWSYRPLRYPDLGGVPRDLIGRPAREPDQRPIVDQDIVFRDGIVLRVDRNRVN